MAQARFSSMVRPSGAGMPSTTSRSGSPAAWASIVRMRWITPKDLHNLSLLCAPFTPITSCCRCRRGTSSRWRSTRGCASASSPRASSRPTTCTRRRWRRSRICGSFTIAGYVDAVANGTVPREIQRRIGFPWSPQMVERSRRSVGATIAAARAALDDGVAANLAGGTHHAFADRGEGFCVFNDVAVAARVLQRDQLARPDRDRRSRRAPGQRHGRDLQRRPVGVHVLDARRQELSRSRRKSAISTCRSPTAPVTTSICRCCSRTCPTS